MARANRAGKEMRKMTGMASTIKLKRILIARRTRRAVDVACGERGGALVELALVIPVILLLITGMFSVSLVMYQKETLAEAVSSGARFLAADRGDNDPCASTANVVYGAAPNLSQSKISLSFVLNGTSYPTTTTCSGTSAMASGATATLTATYPCTLAWYSSGALSCSLTVKTSEVIQ